MTFCGSGWGWVVWDETIKSCSGKSRPLSRGGVGDVPCIHAWMHPCWCTLWLHVCPEAHFQHPPPFEDLLIIDNWSPASSMHHTRHLNIISKNITISTPFLKTLEVPVTQIPMTSCKPEWSPVVCPLLRPQLTQWVFTQSRRCSSSFTDSAQ